MANTKVERNKEIKDLRDRGMTIQEIAKIYNISHQAVSAIVGRLKNKRVGFKKLKSNIQVKTYLDYLKESDYSNRIKGFYIKNYYANSVEQSAN